MTDSKTVLENVESKYSDSPTGALRSRLEAFPVFAVFIVALVVGSIALMVGVLVWLSFLHGTPASVNNRLSTNHYIAVLGQRFTYSVVGNTLTFAVGAVSVALVLGGWLAWLCERTNFGPRRLTYQLMTMGLLIPGFLFALGWQYLLGPHIGALSDLFPNQSSPLNIASPFGMGILQGLLFCPAAFIMIAPALRSMDGYAEEAAEVADAGIFLTLRKITLPIIRASGVGAIIYVVTIAIGAFDVPAILGLAVRKFTLSTYVYQFTSPSQGQPDFGSAAVIGVLLLLVGAILSLAYMRVLAKTRSEAGPVRPTGGGRRRLSRSGHRVGRVVLGIYSFGAIILPVVALIWMALLPYAQQPSVAAIESMSFNNFHTLPWSTLIAGAKNTGILVIFVPLISVGLVGISISWYVVQSRFRFRSAVDAFAFAPHVIPPVVAGLAWLLMALYVIDRVFQIYDSIWIIVLAMSVAFLGFATRMTNGAFSQVGRDLIEACEVASISSFRTLIRVTLPLSRSALFGAWIWVALLAYRELALPAILSSPGNITLATGVYSLYTAGQTGSSAAAAVVVFAIVAPAMAAMWWFGGGMSAGRFALGTEGLR